MMERRTTVATKWTEITREILRVVHRSSDAPIHLWSQAGRNWADAFPVIVAAIGRLKVDSVVLDGEAVCLLDDGRPDFHGLRSREGCKTARLIAFDLLGLNGEDLRRMPLSERRKRLADLMGGDDALWLSSHVQGAQGEALFRQACALNLEGIVSKRIDTPYRSGPFLVWRKIKCPGYARP